MLLQRLSVIGISTILIHILYLKKNSIRLAELSQVVAL
jgi:hypothetical protein